MIRIEHIAAAQLLFAAGTVPAGATDAAMLIAREYRRRHGDLHGVVADMAAELGAHPEATARMAACLRIAPLRVELTDSIPTGLNPFLGLIGCEIDDCEACGPYELVGRRLYCAAHRLAAVTDVLLGASAGHDEGEHHDRH